MSDANTTLEAIRELIQAYYSRTLDYECDVEQLCALVDALDTCLSKGGLLPNEWRKQAALDVQSAPNEIMSQALPVSRAIAEQCDGYCMDDATDRLDMALWILENFISRGVLT
ncbi:MAG: hypothetical protein ACREA0_01630 [bacterium]